MSTENKEFYDLLNSIVEEQVFSLDLSPNEAGECETVNCKQLSTSQLKELIKTIVDSPLTQAAFNSTATKIFKESLIELPGRRLNVIDRLLFILATRTHSLSPTMSIKNQDTTVIVNFDEINKKLEQQLKENANLLVSSTATEGQLTIHFGVAELATEAQLNEELYKNINLNVDDADELRKVLGEAFINEIAKAIYSITIGDKTLDFSTVTFKSRLKTIESLPASLIQKVIEYIEKYKKVIDECLTIDGQIVPIDGSLFSLR
jgi:hypothetical protein